MKGCCCACFRYPSISSAETYPSLSVSIADQSRTSVNPAIFGSLELLGAASAIPPIALMSNTRPLVLTIFRLLCRLMCNPPKNAPAHRLDYWRVPQDYRGCTHKTLFLVRHT